MTDISVTASLLKEYHLCVLGCDGVGKTSLAQRLAGIPFNRKAGHKPSMEDDVQRYSFEVDSSSGPLLFHLYDWAWEQKRRDQNINQQLMRGRDGAIFIIDVTDRRTRTEFSEFSDWYQRAAGFEKPWMIVCNKTDQKKRAVREDEGQALARQVSSLLL